MDIGEEMPAVAEAESFWEQPIVGRFLRPDRHSPPPAA
jgi:hypothetical protein